MYTHLFVWLVISFLFCHFVNLKINCDGSIRYNKRIVVFIGIIYLLFASFRNVISDTSLDAYNYYQAFIIADVPFFEYIKNSTFELGYTIVTWIFRQISNVYIIQLFILHAAIYSMHFYFLKHIKWGYNKFLIIATIFLGLFASFYLFRTYLAVSIALVTIIKLSQKKYFLSGILIFVAISFHNSALILIPVYGFNILFDKRKSLKSWKLALFSFSILIITFLLSKFLYIYMSNDDKYSYYQNDGSSAVGLWGCLIIILIFSFAKFTKVMKSSKIIKTLVISLCANLIVIPLQLQYGIMYRMNLYFVPFTLIMLMELQNIYKKNKKWYLFIKIFTILYCIYKIFSFFTKELQHIGIPYTIMLN